MTFRSFVTVLVCGSVYIGQSQTCCSGGIPLSNNIGLDFSEHQTLILGTSYDFNHLHTLKNESETLNDHSRLRNTHSVIVNIGYTISKRFSAEGLFTWVNQRRTITQFESKYLDETSGIGDAIILLRYALLKNPESHWNVNLGIGAKIPLGSTTKTNEQGITYNADLQPGSNAWDTVYLLGASKTFGFRPTITFSSRLVYRQTGKNNTYLKNSTYEFGDEIVAYLSMSDQYVVNSTLLNPGLSFKYRIAAKDKVNSFEIPNTGGNWVFIIPNISVQIFQNITFVSAVEIPLFSKPDGIQLTPTYRLTLGLLFNLISKPEIIPLN